jgi:XTP/dITP diphosphohydrolase
MKSIPTVVLATRNRHKVLEIKAILREARIKVHLLSLADCPSIPIVNEDRSTIEGNAKKKALTIAKYSGHYALADDTGLFIKVLGGRPGVFSARFAGPQCSYEANNRKVLRLMRNVLWSKRQATFRCVAALATPWSRVFLAEGRIHGRIAFEKHGKNGFGYDPIFYVPSLKKTFAEISLHEKNAISHRARAFRKVPKLLQKALRGI